MIHDKQLPRRMSIARNIAVTNMTLGLLWATTFWQVWTDVLFPDGEKHE